MRVTKVSYNLFGLFRCQCLSLVCYAIVHKPDHLKRFRWFENDLHRDSAQVVLCAGHAVFKLYCVQVVLCAGLHEHDCLRIYSVTSTVCVLKSSTHTHVCCTMNAHCS